MKCIFTGEETSSLKNGLSVSIKGREVMQNKFEEFNALLLDNKFNTVSKNKFLKLCTQGVDTAFNELNKVIEEVQK